MLMRDKKDCLFLCQFFYPEYVSSATLPFDTARALKQSGLKVSAICGYPKEYTKRKDIPVKEIHEGIEITRLRYLQMDRKSFLGRAVNYLSLIVNMILHIPVMAGYKMIFVYSNPPFLPVIAVWIKKLFRCKLIFISYDVYPEIGIRSGKIRKGSMVDKCFRVVNHAIEKNADFVIACSEDMKVFWEGKRNLHHGKVVSIPNWYQDTDINTSGRNSNLLSGIIKENDLLVSYLGNLGTCQDLRTILNCIRKMKDEVEVHFLFAGHGNKMEKLKEIVQKESLGQVHIFPFLQGNDYDAALARSDIFIVSLIPHLKGLCSPSKASGYFMAGKPVLAIMDTGMELSVDIIENRCGYVIENTHCKELKDKILYLKKNPHVKSEMGASAKALFIEKYEKNVCLRKYVELVKRIICDV